MKTIIALLFVSIYVASQDIDINLSKTEKTIITTVFSSAAFYTIVKPGCSDDDKIMVGILSVFAIFPHVMDMPKNITINSRGINVTIPNNRYGCYVSSNKKKSLKCVKNKRKHH